MNTNMKTLCRAALALILILRLARFVAAEEPTRLPINDAAIEKLLTTDFYGIYMQAKKIGCGAGRDEPYRRCRSGLRLQVASRNEPACRRVQDAAPLRVNCRV